MRRSTMRTMIIIALLSIGVELRAATVTYAIVIGNNAPPAEQASENLKPLRYADDDAVRFFELFQKLGANAKLLSVLDEPTQRRYPNIVNTAQEPSHANLLRIVEEFSERMQADLSRGDKPVFYFTYSGHGARAKDSGRVFLALIDKGLRQRTLYRHVLAKLPAVFSHVLIDACNAASVVGFRGEMFGKELDGQTVALTAKEMRLSKRLERHPTVGVIIATTTGQQAHEWSEYESGVFTHEVLSALLGAGDVNGDRKIEYSELHAFIAAANRDIRDHRAIPRVIAEPPRINRRAPLVALSDFRNTGILTGSSAGLGPFHIEMANGQRYLDAHMSDDSTTALALPADTPVFVRTENEEAELVLKPGARVNFGELQFHPRVERARGGIATMFREALFASPFGPTYYRGFIDRSGGMSVNFPSTEATRSLDVETSDGLGVGLLVGAGIAGAVSVATGVLAWQAKQDFNRTNFETKAARLRDRHFQLTTTAIVAATITAVAGTAAWWVWPELILPATSNAKPSGLGLTFETQW